MNIHMQQYSGDGDYWSLTFISKEFEFTEEDLAVVRRKVELSGGERELQPLDRHDRPGGGPTGSYRGGWDRHDGLSRTNRIVVSCTMGQRPGPAIEACRILKQRYPNARFTMHDYYLREALNKQGLSIFAP